MKTYALMLPVILVSLFLGSCRQELALNDDLNQVVASRAAQDLPFQGSYVTFATVLAPPPMLQQEIEGSGHATHLGQSSFIAQSTVDMTSPPPFNLSGTSVSYAANGDELYTIFTGTVTPDGQGANDVVINHTITGGTGRFENAEGNFTGYTVAVPGLAEGEIDFEGSISY